MNLSDTTTNTYNNSFLAVVIEYESCRKWHCKQLLCIFIITVSKGIFWYIFKLIVVLLGLCSSLFLIVFCSLLCTATTLPTTSGWGKCTTWLITSSSSSPTEPGRLCVCECVRVYMWDYTTCAVAMLESASVSVLAHVHLCQIQWMSAGRLSLCRPSGAPWVWRTVPSCTTSVHMSVTRYVATSANLSP